MNHYKMTGKLFYTALVCLFCSCGNNEKKTTTETATIDSTTTTTKDTTPIVVTPGTITTAAENMIIVRHKVADYAKWQISYDAHDSMRRASGLHNYVIGRGMADSNVILIAIKADDMAKAKAFSKSPSLKEAMQKSGVTGPPSMLFATTSYMDTAILATPIRSMNIMTVKDADAWRTAFNEGKQERMDNGIVDRVISRDADNDKKIILVTALLDTAKANAYSTSDALKKRREAGGVIGTPERFVFRVVKRY
ncbi:MAG: hypothetical protein H7258_04790 [Ferruginibacter sp.]|nr:hypothetical protein [Ferruginibacter sp.]